MKLFFISTALLSGFVFFYGLVSLFIKEKFGLSDPLVATLFGIILKKIESIFTDEPQLLLKDQEFVKKELSRLVVSLQVVATGLTVPQAYFYKEWKSLFWLLFPLTLLTFFISSSFAHVLLEMDICLSLCIGACVTPTDPVLAAAIMKGKFATKYVPSHIRNLLTIESGANDGLGCILLSLALLTIKKNLSKALFKILFIDVLLSITVGACLGYCGQLLLISCKKRNFIDKESLLVSMISLGILVTALTALFHSMDILASFVCGMFFSSNNDIIDAIRESKVNEIIDQLINHIFFIAFGYYFRFEDFTANHFAYILIVLFVRRLPLFLMFQRKIPQLKNRKEAFFAGYFGPVGVGALLFAYHGYDQLRDIELKGKENFLQVIHHIVLGSIIAHGVVGFILINFLKKTTKNEKNVEELVESEFDIFSNNEKNNQLLDY